MQYELDTPRMTRDDESHLNGLAIAHYVFGGVGMFFSLFNLIFVFIGIATIYEAMNGSGEALFGLLFLAIGIFFFAFGEIVSYCIFLSGRHLEQRRGYTFSFVMACICCINAPLGTVLGVLTIIVLSRPAVKAAFGES